jgi:hypothetical protein
LDLNGRSEDNNNNGAVQSTSYQTHFPVYWEHPSVVGVTLWGYVTGATWIGGTGLTSNTGVEKPAMIWLKSYMSGKSSMGFPICTTGACANAGQSPTVSLTSPTNNASFTTLQTINLTASASDADGTVSKVEFYDGTILLGTDNTSPYSYSWSGMSVGTHVLTAKATDNTGNVTISTAVTVSVVGVQVPYNNTPHPIPGIIQLEEFDLGGNGLAYLDNTPGSAVTPVVNFRTTEDVDIETCTDAGGGYNIGYSTAGEWLEYTVNVQVNDQYNIDLRVACDGDERTASLSMDGITIANNIAIPNTGGWQTWQTITVPKIPLTVGQKVMRLTIGATDYVNLNYVQFRSVITGVADGQDVALSVYPNPSKDNFNIELEGEFSYQLMDVTGKELEAGSSENSAQIGRNLSKGVYLLRIDKGNGFKIQKIIKD